MHVIIFLILNIVSSTLSYARCSDQQLHRREKVASLLEERKAARLTSSSEDTFLSIYPYTQSTLEFDSVFSKRNPLKVDYVFYESKSPKTSPLVIILSPITGVNTLDHWMGSYFAERGIHALISYYRAHKGGYSKLENVRRDIIENLQAQMTVTDWIVKHRNIDKKRIGLLGMSFGAIRASFLLGIDKRIGNTVLSVVGDSFADILGHSKHRLAIAIRERQMKDNAIADILSYKTRFRQQQDYFITDSLCDKDGRSVSLHLDKNDDVILSRLQQKLSDKLPHAEVHWTNVGHMFSILKLGFQNLDEVINFFKRNWYLQP